MCFFPHTWPVTQTPQVSRCRCVSSVLPCRQRVTSLGLKIESGWKFFVPSPTVSTGRGEKKFLRCLKLLSGANEGRALTSLCYHGNPSTLRHFRRRLLGSSRVSCRNGAYRWAFSRIHGETVWNRWIRFPVLDALDDHVRLRRSQCLQSFRALRDASRRLITPRVLPFHT